MPTPVKLPDSLMQQASRYAAAHHRSIPKQIEHWATIGKAAEDNPDLPYSFIRDLMLAIEESNDGEISKFTFSKKS